LGARNSDIESIYVNENLYSGFISLLLSFVISYPLSILVNHLIDKYLSIKGIVQIPYLYFKGVPFFYPLILLTSLILLVYIATILPIRFSKRQSLSLELKVND
jgi:ABC-type antimicrobial peptide transport system permease subunit